LTIVGYGTNPDGNTEAWIVTVFSIGGYIDWFDLAAFCNRWLDQDCNDANSWCERADFNEDGVVDIVDFAIIAESWLQSSIED